VFLIKLGRTRYEKRGVGAFNDHLTLSHYATSRVRVEVDLEKTFSLYHSNAEMVFELALLKRRHVATEATWLVGENVAKILPKHKDIQRHSILGYS